MRTNQPTNFHQTELITFKIYKFIYLLNRFVEFRHWNASSAKQISLIETNSSVENIVALHFMGLVSSQPYSQSIFYF